jgi:hypothetical protein
MNAFILTIVIIGGAHKGEFFNVIPNEYPTMHACQTEREHLLKQMLYDGTIETSAEATLTCEGGT